VKAGDIFAIFGVECSTGDTLTQSDNSYPVRCQSMFVPDPVMSLTIKPAKSEGAVKL
jgi:elongation factor G